MKIKNRRKLKIQSFIVMVKIILNQYKIKHIIH